ncbi:hypothetical protein QL285_079135 [Trifolium repens]|nr:hypothetical protein QL285_079135 [Trifolium repens]
MASSSSPWRVHLSSSEGFCHVINKFQTTSTRSGEYITRPGELPLVVACEPIFQLDALCLYSPCTRSGVYFARPGEFCTLWRVCHFPRMMLSASTRPALALAS